MVKVRFNRRLDRFESRLRLFGTGFPKIHIPVIRKTDLQSVETIPEDFALLHKGIEKRGLVTRHAGREEFRFPESGGGGIKEQAVQAV